MNGANLSTRRREERGHRRPVDSHFFAACCCASAAALSLAESVNAASFGGGDRLAGYPGRAAVNYR